ncbi:MAG: hypothetical protein RSA53_05765 [Odoribacter sp.]
MFNEIEHNAAKIDGGEEEGEVGGEKPRHAVAGDPREDNGYGVHSTDQGNEAQKNPKRMGDDGENGVDDVEVGDRHKKKKKIMSKETPTVMAVMPADQKVEEKDEADDEVEVEDETFGQQFADW